MFSVSEGTPVRMLLASSDSTGLKGSESLSALASNKAFQRALLRMSRSTNIFSILGFRAVGTASPRSSSNSSGSFSKANLALYRYFSLSVASAWLAVIMLSATSCSFSWYLLSLIHKARSALLAKKKPSMYNCGPLRKYTTLSWVSISHSKST